MATRKRPPVAAEPTAAWPPPTDLLADPLVAPPVDTAVAPLPPAAGPPAEVADNRFGMGMLLGLVVLLAVGGVIAAILLTRHHHQAAAVTTTVVVGKPATVAGSNPSPAGPASVVVRRFIGQPKKAAASALRGQGFTVRFATVAGSAPAGVVVGQDPAPQAKAAAHSVVTLQLSNGAAAAGSNGASTVTVTTSGSATTATGATSTAATTTAAAPPKPATASVPDVSGNQVQAAAQSLGAAGFPVSIAYVPSTEPLGTVVAQSPGAGTSEPTTAHVTINAASGPGQKQQESVPDATGKSIPDAVSAMNGAGLRLFLLKKAVCDRSLAGKVVEQTPAAGKTAPHNAQVLVYMGAFQSTNC